MTRKSLVERGKENLTQMVGKTAGPKRGKMRLDEYDFVDFWYKKLAYAQVLYFIKH